ncbi:MAG: PEP-CTERM sorting domain-containing protein [Sedimentisphaerales bacterium]
MKKLIFCLILAAAFAMNASATTTGTFTGPLTNAILSVDLNGGTTSNDCPTEGWNGSKTTPVLNADPYGVTWSPWGGPTNTCGDGTALPSGTGVSSISKTFGTKKVTISLPGNLAKYASGYMNSRDRGSPTPNYNTDNDMFRDLLYVGGSSKQSNNYMQIDVNGLTPGMQYQLALYSYDWQNAKTVNWTATAPINSEGWVATNGNFTAPADEQTITWTSGGARPAPAVFTLTANSSGVVTVWGWGGDGITGHNSADTTYINGFQITPEPATMTLLCLGGLALLRKRS